MTEQMKKFKDVLDRAQCGKDVGLQNLKESIFLESEVKSKRYGDVYLNYTPILSIGMLNLSKNQKKQLYYDDVNDKLYYVEKIHFSGIDVFGDNSVLSLPFEICIIHNMYRLLNIYHQNFEVLVENGIKIFTVTKCGCFDILDNYDKCIPNNYAIENCFKNSNIIAYPSEKSKFAEKLKNKLGNIVKENYESMLNKEEFKFSLDCKVIKTSYDLSNITEVSSAIYIDNKLFCDFYSRYSMKAEFCIKNNYTEDIKFESQIGIFGLGTKISSELLANCNEIKNVYNNSKFNTLLVRDIDFRILSGGIEELKSKYYSELINLKYNKTILKEIKERIFYLLFKDFSFKSYPTEKSAFGKVLLANTISSYSSYEDNKYIISLYTQNVVEYQEESAFKKTQFLVQNKSNNEVVLITLLEAVAQVRQIENDIAFPVIYFIPYNIFIGNEFVDYQKKKVEFYFDIESQLYNYIRESILNEFGSMVINKSVNSTDIYFDENKLMQILNNPTINLRAKTTGKTEYKDVTDVEFSYDGKLLNSGMLNARCKKITLQFENKDIMSLTFLNENSNDSTVKDLISNTVTYRQLTASCALEKNMREYLHSAF